MAPAWRDCLRGLLNALCVSILGLVCYRKPNSQFSKNLPAVLQDLSFKVPPGSRIGICGRTGSGKSSTVNALFRTVSSDLVTGKLLIDGVEVQELPLRTLRSSLRCEVYLLCSYFIQLIPLTLSQHCSPGSVFVALDYPGMLRWLSSFARPTHTHVQENLDIEEVCISLFDV